MDLGERIGGEDWKRGCCAWDVLYQRKINKEKKRIKARTLNFTCALGKQIKTGRHHCKSVRDCSIQY